MNYTFISLLFLLSSVYGETITYTNTTLPVTDTIECQDATTDCIINCDTPSACSNTSLHCHPTSSLWCTINFNAGSSGYAATIYTHSSPMVSINGNAVDCAHYMKVHAYDQGSTRLFITGTFLTSFQYSYIYGPVGEGSFLWMKGGHTAFKYAKIYDDWTTSVRLEPLAYGTFKDANVSNIFDFDGLNITRDDAAYNNVDMTYRAPVYLLDCGSSKEAFARFVYNGVNHGDWYTRPQENYGFNKAWIFATTDSRVNQSVPYDIKMYGASARDFTQTNLVAGAGANVYFDIIGYDALKNTAIHAKAAKSLNIYCHGTGYCYQLTIECPDNASPNSCNWICDSPNCGNVLSTIEIPTPDAYDCNSLYLESRIFATIYCGYNQTADSCSYQSNGTNLNYTCDSACGTQCAYDNVIAPTTIGTEINALCNDTITFPPTITFTTAEPTATTADPTVTPSQPPSTTPSYSPSHAPSKAPSGSPTQPPSSSPTQPPSKAPSGAPSHAPSRSPSDAPSLTPTQTPTKTPSRSPSNAPTKDPTFAPTLPPTSSPSRVPSNYPTFNPSLAPSVDPTPAPTHDPSSAPSRSPTKGPTIEPTKEPSKIPTRNPTAIPTKGPTADPTKNPTMNPTTEPTINPTKNPTMNPTKAPSKEPTKSPTINPTPTNAVTTNYEVKIDVNCDDDNDNTECAIDPDVLNQVIENILVINEGSTVEIVSAEVVDDDLVIRLSITTGPENVLQPDVISHHIERQIQDNDDFGDVETEEKDDDFNDIKEEPQHPVMVHARNILNNVEYVVALICGVCCVSTLCYCYGRQRVQKELINRQHAELVKMVSLSSLSPTSPVSSDMGPADGVNTEGEGGNGTTATTMDRLGELKDLPDEFDERDVDDMIVLETPGGGGHGDVALNSQQQEERKDDSKNENGSSSDDDDDTDVMYDMNKDKRASYVMQTPGGDAPPPAVQKPSSQMMGGAGGFGGFGGGFEPIFETPGDMGEAKDDKDNNDVDDAENKEKDKNDMDNMGDGFGGFGAF